MRKPAALAHDVSKHAIAAFLSDGAYGLLKNLKIALSHIGLVELVYKGSARAMELRRERTFEERSCEPFA